MGLFEHIIIQKDLEANKKEIDNLKRIRLYKDDSWNPIFAGLLVIVHVLGVLMDYWKISFGLFMGIVLYLAIFNYYKRILAKIDINTLELYNAICIKQEKNP